MKKILIASIATIGIVGLTACGGGNSKEAVATTDAGDITKDEFYDALKKENGEQVLQQLITVKVIEGEYEASDEEIDEVVDGLKEQLGDNYEDYIAQQGLTEEDVRENAKLQVLQDKLMTDGIEVSDEDAKAYYERMKQEVHVRHILVEDEETAKEVKKKLDDGGDFKKLAKKYSTDTANSEKGGDLDYFSVGVMLPEFEDAAYDLELNKVSDPVKTDYGYHILEVLDKRDIKDSDVGSFEDNEKEIIETLKERQVDYSGVNDRIAKLLNDANIEIKDDAFKDLFSDLDSQDNDTEANDKDNNAENNKED